VGYAGAYGNAPAYGGGSGGGYYGGGAGGTQSEGGKYCSPGGSTSFISGFNDCIAIANPLSDVANDRTPKTEGNISALTFNNVEDKSQD
jgi:hypothetical protein